MFDEEELYDSPFFHLTFPKFPEICQNCSKIGQSPLSRCATCQVVHYCSKECQVQNWPVHKPLCKEVKRTLAEYKEEEQKLKHFRSEFYEEHHNYFEEEAFKYEFFFRPETRDYCCSIAGRIMAYENIGTAAALQVCVELLMKYFYHARMDGFGNRHMVPSFLLRLGMDQQAHDFIKWHAEFPKDRYEWDDPVTLTDVPYLSYWGTNPRLPNQHSEQPKLYDLYHVMADFLIKFRIFSDKRALNALFISSRCPSSCASLGSMSRFDRLIWDNIGSFLTKKYPNSDTTLAELQDHLHHLLNLLDYDHKVICRAFLYPGLLFSQPEPHYQHPYLIVRDYIEILETMPAAKEFIRDHCIKVYGKKNLSKFNTKIEKRFYMSPF
jgi:hypothetical protein